MNEITNFFDKLAINRNIKIKSNPIVEYEQITRSNMVIFMLDPKANEMILDVGCGNGRDLIPLAKKGCICIGIDLSSNMVEQARKDLLKCDKQKIQLGLGDATNLSFLDRSFDKVFASEVLEHLPNYNKAISEMARVLKVGGTLIITTPNRRSLYGFDRYVIYQSLLRKKWKNPYDSWKTFDELVSALKKNGFKIEDYSGICYIPGFIFSYRLPRSLKKLLLIIINRVESKLKKIFPKNGYMLAIKAKKLKSQN